MNQPGDASSFGAAHIYGAPPFFELTSHEAADLAKQTSELVKAYQSRPPAPPLIEPNPEAAAQSFRDLQRAHAHTHQTIRQTLQPTYLRIASLITGQALHNPEAIQQIAEQAKMVEVPYSLSALPPNLFDHRQPPAPFIPSTLEEACRLAVEWSFFDQRLSRKFAIWSLGFQHPYLTSDGIEGVIDELLRRRQANDQTFATAAGRQQWQAYRAHFLGQLSNPRADRLSLLENAKFVSYPNNRRFTQEGGFFEKATGRFHSFLLTDIFSLNRFTTQIRTPIGAYGREFAEDFARATYAMAYLIFTSLEVETEIDALAASTPPDCQAYLNNYLMRSGDQGLRNPFSEGVLYTALEGTFSLNSLESIALAEGLPGEPHADRALLELVKWKIPSKLNAVMPQAVAVPSALHGCYIPGALEHWPLSHGAPIRITRDYIEALKEIDARRLLRLKEQWDSWLQELETNLKNPFARPPVRTGLHCPFKSRVTHQFAIALLVLYRTIRRGRVT